MMIASLMVADGSKRPTPCSISAAYFDSPQRLASSSSSGDFEFTVDQSGIEGTFRPTLVLNKTDLYQA